VDLLVEGVQPVAFTSEVPDPRLPEAVAKNKAAERNMIACDHVQTKRPPEGGLPAALMKLK
jgi:hypothetical protein